MKKMMWFIPVIVLGFSVSCSKIDNTSNLYVPSSSDTTAKATLAELQQGRTLYISNCQSCHSLYSPDDFTPDSWRSIISVMAPRTGMNASQVALVTKYVTRGR